MTKRTSSNKNKAFSNKRVSKATCKRQTLKKYVSRPSPPYRATMCVGQRKRGNDGNMYISKTGMNYAPAKWVRI